ncbi:hypothetical protein FACS1894186_6850 [Alphaproteobacteria bacterium]|nr:hypothetical protein FACS1894186_6850 [Alphaproteobacteria bacterium]
MKPPFWLGWIPDIWRCIKWLFGLTRVERWRVIVIIGCALFLWAVWALRQASPPVPQYDSLSLGGIRGACRKEADCLQFIADLDAAGALAPSPRFGIMRERALFVLAERHRNPEALAHFARIYAESLKTCFNLPWLLRIASALGRGAEAQSACCAHPRNRYNCDEAVKYELFE